MAQALTASMPQFTELGYNATIVLEAIDPTTGDPVDGVVVSSVDIYADIVDASSTSTGPTPQPFAVGLYPLTPGAGTDTSTLTGSIITTDGT